MAQIFSILNYHHFMYAMHSFGIMKIDNNNTSMCAAWCNVELTSQVLTECRVAMVQRQFTIYILSNACMRYVRLICVVQKNMLSPYTLTAYFQKECSTYAMCDIQKSQTLLYILFCHRSPLPLRFDNQSMLTSINRISSSANALGYNVG